MTNVLAQSATLLSESGSPDMAKDLKAMVSRNAIKSIKNPGRVATTERIQLSNSKLLQHCRNEWKDRNNKSRDTQVPKDIDDQLQLFVNEFITQQVQRVNFSNATNLRVSDALDWKNLSIVEKVSLTGTNILEQQRQLEGCNRLIFATKDKLSLYITRDASGNSSKDYTDLIKSCKEHLFKLETVANRIKGNIEAQQAAVKP